MAHRLFPSAVAFFAWAAAISSSIASEQKFEVNSVAEKKISQLPRGQLFWRVGNFPTLAQAQAAAGPTVSSPSTMPAGSAELQSAPPNSDQAKRIQLLVDRAAKLVNAKGKEAFSEFRSRGSEWFTGDTYIFAYAPDGTVVLNPAFPAREGHAYHGEKDKKGKAFHDEIMKTAQTKGSGWVDYWLPKPGHTEPSQKWSYVEAVKTDGVAVIGAGFFPR